MSDSAAQTTDQDAGSVLILLYEDKQCKGSVRYGTKNPDSPVSSIYLSRSFADRMPKSIEVVIRPK